MSTHPIVTAAINVGSLREQDEVIDIKENEDAASLCGKPMWCITANVTRLGRTWEARLYVDETGKLEWDS